MCVRVCGCVCVANADKGRNVKAARRLVHLLAPVAEIMKSRCLSGLLKPRRRQKAALRADTDRNQKKKKKSSGLNQRAATPAALWSLETDCMSVHIWLFM